MSLRFRIVFSAACALLAALLCVSYADHVRSDAERVRAEALARFGGEVAQLVVASERLEPGDVVSRSNVQVRDWVADLAPEQALTDLDAVIGREVGSVVAQGAPLTELVFSEAGVLSDVPAGRVAVTLPTSDKLGISHSVAKGTSLVAYAVTAEGARLLSGDMSVLTEPATNASLGTAAQLTVAVAPDDVPDVLVAAATGDLRLVAPAHDVELQGSAEHQPPIDLADGDEALTVGDELS